MKHLLIIITVLSSITIKAQQHFSIATSTNTINRVGLVGNRLIS